MSPHKGRDSNPVLAEGDAAYLAMVTSSLRDCAIQPPKLHTWYLRP